MLGELDRGWECKVVGQLCVDSRFCLENWIEGGYGREWVNCVLTADCVRGIGERVGMEGSGGIVC